MKRLVVVVLVVGLGLAVPVLGQEVLEFISVRGEWEGICEVEMRDSEGSVLAAQSVSTNCQAVVVGAGTPDPDPGPGACDAPDWDWGGRSFPDGAVEAIRPRWYSGSAELWGLWIPSDCSAVCDPQLVGEQVVYEDGVTVLLDGDAQILYSDECWDALAACGTYEDGWFLRPLQQEWHDDCPTDPPTPSVWPYPTQTPYLTQTAYPTEPVPTCQATIVVSPTLTAMPTYTPLPTYTPYPTQPPLRP